MLIIPVNLATFEQLFFWSVTHLVCHRKFYIQSAITQKIQIGKIRFFIRFRTVRIFHVNMAPSEGGGLHILTWDGAHYKFIWSIKINPHHKFTYLPKNINSMDVFEMFFLIFPKLYYITSVWFLEILFVFICNYMNTFMFLMNLTKHFMKRLKIMCFQM